MFGARIIFSFSRKVIREILNAPLSVFGIFRLTLGDPVSSTTSSISNETPILQVNALSVGVNSEFLHLQWRCLCLHHCMG